MDVSDLAATREVAQAEAERQIVKMEQKRLGLEAESPDAPLR